MPKLNPLKNLHQSIIIRGAREHNLKNISLEIPRNKFVVITGVSGSGKSTLAFDTLYAEGQRRFVESLSVYARQFLDRMPKPDVDAILNISPTIAIEQKSITKNPRSTVATTTEIYDYLRLLFARIGKTFCLNCGEIILRDSVESVVNTFSDLDDGKKFYIAFEIPTHHGHSFKEECDALKARGFFRLLINNEVVDLNESEVITQSKKNIYVLVDRYIHRSNTKTTKTRLADSIQTAFVEGNGYVSIFNLESNLPRHFNQHFECANCKIKYDEPEPSTFTFNNPLGACKKCQGFGRSIGIDLDLVVPRKEKSISDGAILAWTTPYYKHNMDDLLSIANEAKVRVDIPFSDLTSEELQIVLNGYKKKYHGIYGFFKSLEKKLYKIQNRVMISRYRGYTICDECNGSRLKKEALAVKISKKTIFDISCMRIEDAKNYFENLELSKFDFEIAKRILTELKKRLNLLNNVGVGYLSLNRLSMTLSGGEAQRINLATSIGSSLIGATYILDEPSIGLHPHDTNRLIKILKSLRDLKNSVIVVEHDSEIIRSCDHLIDIGPFAGERGGEIIYEGKIPNKLPKTNSLTLKYLFGKEKIPIPKKRGETKNGKSITIRGAKENNLKNITVSFPLNKFVCVTGISGSGKSTLIHQILYAHAMRRFGATYVQKPGAVDLIEGFNFIDGIVLVDQSPIGRTPRSNPATYIKVFDEIRELLSKTTTSKLHGYSPGFFSFNVAGGRCDACEGDGFQKIEMQFMADIYLECESCKGKRFKDEALQVFYQNKNVDDILNMTVDSAIEFFSQFQSAKKVVKKLQPLFDVGLGYIRLGQSATTLSGGEAQRVKLAAYLTSQKNGNQLFIFDEPTTGLHFDDIKKLLACFEALIETGHSIIVIEHNLEVIKCADFIVDLGPMGGVSGGEVVATGSPNEICRNTNSITGKYLKAVLV